MSEQEKSHAVKMLALIEARLEGRALKEHSEYSIKGRSLKLMSMEELISARSKYLVEVHREEAAKEGRSRTKIFAAL